MFIRKKKIGNNEYAYLVKNKYNKRRKQSRQISKKYLGRVISFSRLDNGPINSPTIRGAILKELSFHGFNNTKNKSSRGTIVIDLDRLTVKDKDKNVCLELNDGFLCNETLTNLLNFNTKNLSQKQIIREFANTFVSAGINLHHKSFIHMYSVFSKNS